MASTVISINETQRAVSLSQSGNSASRAWENSAQVADTATSSSTRPGIQQELLARYKPLASETEVDASDGSAMTREQQPRPGRRHRGPLTEASPMHSTRRVSLLSYGGFDLQKSHGAPAGSTRHVIADERLQTYPAMSLS